MKRHTTHCKEDIHTNHRYARRVGFGKKIDIGDMSMDNAGMNGSLMSFMDRVIFMDGGYIVETGTPEDIFQNPREPRFFLNKVL